MKKIISTLILLLIVGGIAFALFNNKQEMNVKAEEAMKTTDFIPVRTQTVGTSLHQISFSANGTFKANQELNLKSEAGGKVLKIFKRKGDFVKEGQTIAQLDDEILQSELAISTLNYEQSLKDLERYKNLAGTDAITKKQLEEIQNGSKTAEAQLNMIKKRISLARITAPISGFINEDYIEIGALINPGMQVVDIVNTQPLQLTIYVSESEIAQISVGDTVVVKAGVSPDKEYKGKVSFTSSQGDASLKYEVEIMLDGATDNLKPGMFGYANFNYNNQETIMIDRKSLVSGLKNPQVYVLEDGKARLKSVKIASLGQDQLALLDGLEIGEKLITSGLINLQDGTAVSEL